MRYLLHCSPFDCGPSAAGFGEQCVCVDVTTLLSWEGKWPVQTFNDGSHMKGEATAAVMQHGRLNMVVIFCL